jgi:hypothetical protein
MRAHEPRSSPPLGPSPLEGDSMRFGKSAATALLIIAGLLVLRLWLSAVDLATQTAMAVTGGVIVVVLLLVIGVGIPLCALSGRRKDEAERLQRSMTERSGQRDPKKVSYDDAYDVAAAALIDLKGLDKRNWDGEGALPITAGARENARWLLWAFYNEYPAPEVVPTPDGTVKLEWHMMRGGRVLEIIVDVSDRRAHLMRHAGDWKYPELEFNDIFAVPRAIRSSVLSVAA